MKTNKKNLLVRALAIVLSVLIVVMNLLSDLLYKLCDPRIKLR